MDIAVEVGLLLTAGVLGVTHGIEPDHVAGVAALTHEAGSARLSAVAGACFAAGHVTLVVLWVGIAYLFLDVTAFPSGLESFGLVVVGAVLALLSLVLGVVGARKLLHRHEHDHGERRPHAHLHLHLPSTLRPGGDRRRERDEGGDDDPGTRGHAHDRNAVHGHEHEHEHTVAEFLKLGVVGALFTLSPPLSMIAFVSLTLAEADMLGTALVVATYAAGITATMTAVGGGAGALFGATKARGARAHAAAQLVTAAAVLGIGVHLLAANLPAVLSA